MLLARTLSDSRLPSQFCFHRNVQAPPAAAGGPLHVTKVGAVGDSDPFSFTWDYRAPPAGAVGADLQGRAFLEVGTSLDRTAAPPLWVGVFDAIVLSDVAFTLAPWTQCMEPAVVGGAAAGGVPPEPVILVGLPDCLRGLGALEFAAASRKINAATKNGKLMRVIINGFSIACGRVLINAVALLNAALSVLHTLPPESDDVALPVDVGAALLELLEDDLNLQVDDDTRAMMLRLPLYSPEEQPRSSPVCADSRAPSLRWAIRRSTSKSYCVSPLSMLFPRSHWPR